MEEIGEKTPTAAATHEAFSMHRMPLQMLRKRPRQDAKRVRACLVESQRAPCRSGGDRARRETNARREAQGGALLAHCVLYWRWDLGRLHVGMTGMGTVPIAR